MCKFSITKTSSRENYPPGHPGTISRILRGIRPARRTVPLVGGLMRIGIPNGLLYPDFKVLIETFFAELGREIVVSPVTNRAILDLGVNCCVDEACLPIKVFHGHVRWLSEYGRCDMIFIPRIMRLRKNESICPKFCGLTEMVRYSIPDIPPLIGLP